MAEYRILTPRPQDPLDEWVNVRWWVRELRCPCPMCSGAVGHRVKARKARYEGRRLCRRDSATGCRVHEADA